MQTLIATCDICDTKDTISRIDSSVDVCNGCLKAYPGLKDFNYWAIMECRNDSVENTNIGVCEYCKSGCTVSSTSIVSDCCSSDWIVLDI